MARTELRSALFKSVLALTEGLCNEPLPRRGGPPRARAAHRPAERRIEPDSIRVPSGGRLVFL